jgi:hypothetical protein
MHVTLNQRLHPFTRGRCVDCSGFPGRRKWHVIAVLEVVLVVVSALLVAVVVRSVVACPSVDTEQPSAQKRPTFSARYIVRGRKDATQTVLNIEGAQGCCPWSPPQEGARDQSSSARRGLPSKGEARALHHQPAPASTISTKETYVFS